MRYATVDVAVVFGPHQLLWQWNQHSSSVLVDFLQETLSG